MNEKFTKTKRIDVGLSRDQIISGKERQVTTITRIVWVRRVFDCDKIRLMHAVKHAASPVDLQDAVLGQATAVFKKVLSTSFSEPGMILRSDGEFEVPANPRSRFVTSL